MSTIDLTTTEVLRVEEPVELLRNPRLDLDLLSRPDLGGVRQRRDVADHKALALRVGQRFVEHEMDRPHRLRCQTLTGTSRGLAATQQQRRVQPVEITGGQLLRRHPPQHREHVQVEVAPVRVEGPLAELALLDR